MCEIWDTGFGGVAAVVGEFGSGTFEITVA
jgi:hypothetical protein